MKAKRFILMLLVTLGSMTGAWATVVQTNYTILNHDFIVGNNGYYNNFSGQATMDVGTTSAINLSHIVVSVPSIPNESGIKIEGSNNQSDWSILTGRTTIDYAWKDLGTPQQHVEGTISVKATELYQYFRFTFYGTPIVLIGIDMYEDIIAGNGTPQDPYILNSVIFLKQYAQIVAAGNNTACAKLTADLDLDGMTLASIGNASYRGTIDGDGHTVKNLNNENGLFMNIGAATIKNLTLENATLTATGTYNGAFAAQANGTIFQNCTVKGTISASNAIVGGLVGNAVGCTFTDCQVNGLNITGTNVGGLVGNADGTSFTKCLVLSSVTADGCTTVGGLVGKTTNNATFTKCYSIGNYSIGNANAGALVGNPEVSTTFNQCYAATNLNNDGGVHLPICGNAANATFNNSYYYGTGSETAVSKADVGSGRLAYLLNGSVDYGTGPYYQKIGTDKYPLLTGTNYVYRSLDGNSYTNTCPHHDKEHNAYKPLTCLADGNAAYFHCTNPVCNLYFFEDGRTTTVAESTLSSKPVIVKNHSWKDYSGLGYKDNIYIDGTTYYNVTTLYTNELIYLTGDYIVTYTNLGDESTMKFYEFFRLDGYWNVTQNIRYYVNGVERTELRHTLGSINHKEIVVDKLKRHDIVKIVYSYNSSVNTTGTVQLYIAQYRPTGWNGEHSFVTKPADFNCVEGGYDEHYECEICGNAYSSNSHNTTDEDLVSLSNFWLEPNAASHNYALSNQTTDEGLLKYTCQNTNCKAHDPSHFMIPNCVGTTAVEVTYDGNTYSTSSAVSLTDAKAYNSPVPFTTESLGYTRTFSNTDVWQCWYVPFEVEVDESKFKAAEIAGILFDSERNAVVAFNKLDDGAVLKANTPYAVKAVTSDLEFNMTDVTLYAAEENPFTIQSAYDDFTIGGVYSEQSDANWYTLNKSGNFQSMGNATLKPQRFWMSVTPRQDGPYAGSNSASAKQMIKMMVIGDDEISGIENINDDPSTSSGQAQNIYNLNGQKVSSLQSGQVYIINGKKVVTK